VVGFPLHLGALRMRLAALPLLALLAAPLAADVFQVRYAADDRPEKANPPWAIAGDGSIEIADGVLKVKTSADGLCQLTRDWIATPGKGFYVHLRIRILAYEGNHEVGGAALRVGDGEREASILLATDGIRIFGAPAIEKVDLSDRFHDVRVSSSGNDLAIDLDGRPILAGKGRFTQRSASKANLVQFGDISRLAGATWALDLIEYAVGRAGNQAPMVDVTGGDEVQAKEGEPLDLALSATDPDHDEVAWGAKGLPEGASLDEKTGRLTWTPSYASAGRHEVDVTASDGDLSAGRHLAIVVANVNRPPAFAQPKKDDGHYDAETMILFTVRAEDPDGDAVAYRAEGLPDGAAFDPAKGALRWTPTRAQVGNHAVRFFAGDGTVEVERDFTFRVQAKR